MTIKTTKSDWVDDLVELFVENFGTLYMSEDEYRVAFMKLNKKEANCLVLAVREKLPYKSEK